MKIAYLVLAHTNPRVLKRMAGTLSSDDCRFFIHIDQKSGMEQFAGIAGPNVHFIDKRLPVYWGEFSLVEATLGLLRMAMESAPQPDYFVLLSGSDYPIRSSGYICRFLDQNHGREFMNLVKMPAPGKPLSRINTLRYPSHKPVLKFASRALAKIGLAQRDHRKYLPGMHPYSGSQWWALTREACRHILQFVEQNQGFVRYFENTFASDEAFFQTILGNSKFAPAIRRNLHYENWPARGGHPLPIGNEDVEYLKAHDQVTLNDVFGDGELLFARKFSDDRLELLDRIDEVIQDKENKEKREASVPLREVGNKAKALAELP
jgi:Core-2/I-Branching enzyme